MAWIVLSTLIVAWAQPLTAVLIGAAASLVLSSSWLVVRTCRAAMPWPPGASLAIARTATFVVATAITLPLIWHSPHHATSLPNLRASMVANDTLQASPHAWNDIRNVGTLVHALLNEHGLAGATTACMSALGIFVLLGLGGVAVATLIGWRMYLGGFHITRPKSRFARRVASFADRPRTSAHVGLIVLGAVAILCAFVAPRLPAWIDNATASDRMLRPGSDAIGAPTADVPSTPG